MTKSNLGRKEFIPSQIVVHHSEKSGQELRGRNWCRGHERSVAYWLAPDSLLSFLFLFCYGLLLCFCFCFVFFDTGSHYVALAVMKFNI